MLPHSDAANNGGAPETWSDYSARLLRRKIEDRLRQLGRDRLLDIILDTMAAIIAHPEIVDAGRELAKRKRGRR
jgi:hypothetical protein